MPAAYKRAVPYADDAMNLPVENVERALPFYTGIMGFEEVERRDEPTRTVILGRDQVRIGLSENGGDPAQEGCFFEVDDVAAVVPRLLRAGARRALLLPRRAAGVRPRSEGSIAPVRRHFDLAPLACPGL
jgi:catechol 2,3-dioxygenase-like lactoylglutathione lyase family enzyme